ncbi:YtxH domain-containing protein [Flavobacterium sp.]|uniref:YtxH domain-containing protein n=1 Tax=Flavobacterium sp. TaxID=239 RepID=UPI0039E6A61F
MNTGKVALGVLAGLATGAILGILFAPDKGSVTRKKIADKGKDSLDGLKNRYNHVIDNLSSRLEAVKQNGHAHVDEAYEFAEDLKNSAKG